MAIPPELLRLLAGGAIGAVQAGVQAVPGAAERANNERIRGLETQRDRGGFGLTDREGGAILEAGVLPARQQASEAQRLISAQQAAGGGLSAGAQQQGRESKLAQVTTAEAGARLDREVADFEKAGQQEDELSALKASKEAVGGDRRNQLLSTLAGAAGQVGELIGAGPILKGAEPAATNDPADGTPTPVSNFNKFADELRSRGFSDDQIDLLKTIEGREPGVLSTVGKEQAGTGFFDRAVTSAGEAGIDTGVAMSPRAQDFERLLGELRAMGKSEEEIEMLRLLEGGG